MASRAGTRKSGMHGQVDDSRHYTGTAAFENRTRATLMFGVLHLREGRTAAAILPHLAGAAVSG